MAVLRYSIIRYVPDPRRGECINIGVMVVADDRSFIEARFLSKWKRARYFGQEDVSFLKEFAQVVRDRAQHQQPLDPAQQLDGEVLTRMAAEWHNSIQISPPRASVSPDPQKLLEQLFSTYVVEGRPPKRGVRGKQEILSLAQQQLESALSRSFTLDPPRIVRDDLLEGRAVPQEVDMVIRNGGPWMGIEGVSFERVQSDEFEHLVRSMAFVIEDVKKVNDIPMAVVAIPPGTQRTDYDRARRMFESVGAAVITEPELHSWVDRTVQGLSERFGQKAAGDDGVGMAREYPIRS